MLEKAKRRQINNKVSEKKNKYMKTCGGPDLSECTYLSVSLEH